MVLDLDRMAARTGLEREDVVELLEVFLTSAPLAATNLEQAMGNGDFAVAARAAHTVKGSAATVGLTDVAEVAGELERRLRVCAGGEEGANDDGLDARVQALHNCLTRVRDAYEETFP